MNIERHHTGPRMSQIVAHGDTVYLAGVVAHTNKGKSVTEQTREILATIDTYLAQAFVPDVAPGAALEITSNPRCCVYQATAASTSSTM